MNITQGNNLITALGKQDDVLGREGDVKLFV